MADEQTEPLEPVEIPADKLYFKIGEVAKLVGVKPYVLRYWESEFHIVKPGKTRSKHRLYRRKDVETLLRIKNLLHGKRFTIEGARQQLKREAAVQEGGSGDGSGAVNQRAVREILSELLALRETLA